MPKFINFIKRVSMLFICLICWQNVNAADIKADSCSQLHVQEAINKAVKGDTVVIPAGSCNWTGTVTLNTKIVLRGAGYNNTHITRTSNVVINLGSTASRVTGIEFIFGATSENSIPFLKVSGKGWRIDNCKFTNNKVGRSFGVWAQSSTAAASPAGLIDNCVFVNSKILSDGITNLNEQHKEFYEDAYLGSPDAVYVEDCVTIKTALGNVVDSARGGRYVFRFNTYKDGDVQAHALQPDGHDRGTRSWEIYNNSAIGSSVSFFHRPIFLRAGEGVIFNNSITGTWSANALHFDSRRTAGNDPRPDACNGTSPRDTNVAGQNGWICRDNPGAGKDIELTKSTGTHGSYVTEWKDQTHAPIYAWGNSYPIAPNSTSGAHIKANRDYYDGGKWGLQTSSTSPFNGTSGTGRGTLANRPSSCTTGVGYWAVDAGGNWNKANNEVNDGALFKCTATNTWKLYYIPYEYPHPFRNGFDPGPDDPPQEDLQAPARVRIMS